MALQRALRQACHQRVLRTSMLRMCSSAPHAPSASSVAEFQDPKRAVLQAALAHVGDLGCVSRIPRAFARTAHGERNTMLRWSEEALAKASVDAGCVWPCGVGLYSKGSSRRVHSHSLPAVAHGMFPNGGAHIVEYLMEEGTKAMSEHLRELDMTNMSVNERIKAGMKARLAYMAPYIQSLPAAMAVVAATPQHLPAIVHQAGLFADELWFCVGDDSSSLEWYARRGLLVLINGVTELHMIQDTSPGFRDTHAFLDRRLDDAHRLGRGAFEGLAVMSAAASGAGSVLESGLALLRPVSSTAVAGPAAAFSTLMSVASSVMQQAQSAGSAAPPQESAFGAQSGSQPPPTSHGPSPTPTPIQQSAPESGTEHPQER